MGIDETDCTITADPTTPYATVMSTMNAVAKRDDGADPYPDVDLALPPKRWRIVTNSDCIDGGFRFDVVRADAEEK